MAKVEVKQVEPEMAKYFYEIMCEEDVHEIETAWHVPLENLYRDEIEDNDQLVALYMVYFDGEPCVFIGLEEIADAEVPCVAVFTHTSIHFAKYKKTYVRNALRVITEIIAAHRPYAEQVWTNVWAKHRVWGTIKRLLGAEEWYRDENDIIYARLLKVELGVREKLFGGN